MHPSATPMESAAHPRKTVPHAAGQQPIALKSQEQVRLDLAARSLAISNERQRAVFSSHAAAH